MNNQIAPIATIPPADLLQQIGALIDQTQAGNADAEKWRTLVRLLGQMGYGPRIEPATIADLIPNAAGIADIVAASQEISAPAAPKSNGTGGKRRIITDADRRIIFDAYGRDMEIAEIVRQYGYSKSTVNRVLHGTNGNGDAT